MNLLPLKISSHCNSLALTLAFAPSHTSNASKVKRECKPPHTTVQTFVQTLTDIALNVNRLEQNVCGLELYSFGRTAAHAGNIKIKRNLKKKGFGGYRKFVQVMKCVQVQKNATEESGVNNFNYLLHFFASTVVLSIPSFLNFVNPFFVVRHFKQPFV